MLSVVKSCDSVTSFIPGVATGSGRSACSLQQHRVGLDTAKRAVEGAEVSPAGDKEDNELYRSQRGLLYRLVVGDETTQGGNIQCIVQRTIQDDDTARRVLV